MNNKELEKIKKANYSEQQKDELFNKIIILLENSKLNYNHELTILNKILDKYEVKNVSNASKILSKSKQYLYNQIKSKVIPYFNIDNVPFIITNMA